ncbi:MAG: LPS assembly lipoprotein LptE [Planctomycetota bacterium]|jgi:outer membrane lipopolysaccharide assembly protein LptE/RlpB
MSRRLGVSAALLAACAACAGCPYRASSSLPAEFRTIGVTMLRNETRIPGLEGEVTREIVRAIQNDGRLRVIDVDADPDLVLVGRVESYTKRSARTDRYGDPVEYTVVIEARVSVRQDDGDYLFKNVKVTNRASNPESGVVNLGRGQRERRGRDEALSDLGRNVAAKIVEQGW